ncbi:LysR family transcriptional regulator [Sphingomonas sp.]|uniref:LysR family transcriptional regulator n=1 Tax=Sphingomonas sp. TaxID=28214 RepID=UPI003D6CB5C4
MRNWDDLRIFVAVARAQRLAPAARTLGVDVTTVSRRLARLEGEVGAPLFEMLGGERRLSEAGQALLAHAETIEAAVIAVTAGDPNSALAGHVRLSLAEGLATHVVAPGMAAFSAGHPNIRLDLITASGFLNPSKREADIAVMLARPRNRHLRAAKLADYQLGLFATQAYLDERGIPDNAAALEGHTLISYVPEHIHAVELDYLSEIHDGLVAQVRSTSINVQHAMIRSGAGIGILPNFIATRDRSLVPVLPGVALGRSFWLVTHEDTHATPRIQAVIEWLRSVAAAVS